PHGRRARRCGSGPSLPCPCELSFVGAVPARHASQRTASGQDLGRAPPPTAWVTRCAEGTGPTTVPPTTLPDDGDARRRRCPTTAMPDDGGASRRLISVR